MIAHVGRHMLAGLLLLSSFALPHAATAASARKLVTEGNQAYHEGKFAKALEVYDKASVDLPESPQLYFNRGAAFYQQGDHGKATEMFEKAALKTRDLALEARCKYNLGNCSFREAERQTDSDLQKALAGYQTSVRLYQEALKLDPELSDAAHNIEVARLVMKDILDKLKKQQEQAKEQQEKQKEILEKLKELIERQQKALDQNKALAEKKAKSEDVSKLANEQGQIKKDTKALSEKMAQAPQKGQPVQPQLQKAKQHADRSATEQAIAEERLRQEQLAGAQPNQATALEELKKALAALAGQPQQNQGQQQQQQPQPKQQQQQQKRDERAKDILDEEKENQQRRRLRVPGGYRAVDKDW